MSRKEIQIILDTAKHKLQALKKFNKLTYVSLAITTLALIALFSTVLIKGGLSHKNSQKIAPGSTPQLHSSEKKVTATPSIPTGTPVPSRKSNPPTGVISYPAEGATITGTEDNFCFVDAGTGGDLTGIQRARNINNAGWETYVPVFPTSSTCFSPKEGANTFSIQFKNQSGETSPVYTRNFTFQKVKPTPSDTTPPTISSLGGPQNGERVSSDSYCFPAQVTDNVSQAPNLWIRYKFEGGSWNGWSTDMNPCFTSYTNGPVTYSVQAKDEAGNESVAITRSFTINNN